MKDYYDYLSSIMDYLEYTEVKDILLKENMRKSFSEKTNTYYFRSISQQSPTITKKEISIRLDPEASSIMIKNDISVKTDIGNQEKQKVKREQTITKFKVLGGELNVFTFSFIQELNGEEVYNVIENLNSVADFLNINKRKKVGENNITFQQEKFKVSENYHITDGLCFVEEVRQRKLMKKNLQK